MVPSLNPQHAALRCRIACHSEMPKLFGIVEIIYICPLSLTRLRIHCADAHRNRLSLRPIARNYTSNYTV